MKIFAGMKFKSRTFSASAEVVAIREESGEADIMLTPSDQHSFVSKGMSLTHIQKSFERGDYEEIKIIAPFNCSVY